MSHTRAWQGSRQRKRTLSITRSLFLFPAWKKRQSTVTDDIIFSPVSLSYDVFDGRSTGTPLVFLHGLFGCKSNFQSIGKKLVQQTGRKVLTIDARNHGNSAHSSVMTYEAMCSDLQKLMSQLHIQKCVLIGHSMGGKVAMTTALLQPDLVERLVVVDISPSKTFTQTNFPTYITAMKAVKTDSNIPRSTAKRQAEDQLKSFVKDHSVRQFLLTNLIEENGLYIWRVNLDAITKNLDNLLGFPEFDTSYSGPTLFLGGGNSPYICSEDFPEIQQLFPYSDIQYIEGASHWVHADKPHDFINSIRTFLCSP
uniref:sn-1-specific diacylglycerol lipase ABHD11 n=1 Tax=Erpetoichthys calabaricus TaxID=27687 RepID=A0A8C4SFB6_ERPCA